MRRWWRRPARNDACAESVAAPEPAPFGGSGALASHDTQQDLFDFLEDSLEGVVITAPVRLQAMSVSRAMELANDDWPESDAARELLWLVDGDRQVLLRLQEVFEGRLLRSMLPEALGLRVSRLVDVALST
jgi:hypothetical protein